MFVALLLLELPWVTLESSTTALQRRRAHAQQLWQQQQKQMAHGDVAPASIRLGLWDEHTQITPLQLTVALSLATGVDERRVRVASEGNHFFRVDIEGEGLWLVEAINAPESAFIESLNAQAAAFGARMVMSHSAVRSASITVAAPPSQLSLKQNSTVHTPFAKKVT